MFERLRVGYLSITYFLGFGELKRLDYWNTAVQSAFHEMGVDEVAGEIGKRNGENSIQS